MATQRLHTDIPFVTCEQLHDCVCAKSIFVLWVDEVCVLGMHKQRSLHTPQCNTDKFLLLKHGHVMMLHL